MGMVASDESWALQVPVVCAHVIVGLGLGLGFGLGLGLGPRLGFGLGVGVWFYVRVGLGLVLGYGARSLPGGGYSRRVMATFTARKLPTRNSDLAESSRSCPLAEPRQRVQVLHRLPFGRVVRHQHSARRAVGACPRDVRDLWRALARSI